MFTTIITSAKALGSIALVGGSLAWAGHSLATRQNEVASDRQGATNQCVQVDRGDQDHRGDHRDLGRGHDRGHNDRFDHRLNHDRRR